MCDMCLEEMFMHECNECHTRMCANCAEEFFNTDDDVCNVCKESE